MGRAKSSKKEIDAMKRTQPKMIKVYPANGKPHMEVVEISEVEKERLAALAEKNGESV